MTWNTELSAPTADELEYNDTESYLDDDNSVQTRDVTHTGEDALEHWSGNSTSCNRFAFDYQDENPHAIVKVATVSGHEHCYVYDPELDATIDATLGQFDRGPDAGIWNGDEHPHVDDKARIDDYQNEADFEADWIGTHSPFYA